MTLTSVSVRYLSYQPMDEEIKTWLLRFPAKETLIWRRHSSIGQSCCSMTSKRSIGWFLESSRDWSFFHPSVRFNQPKVTRVCTNQIAVSTRLLFLFCSRVFISRSYENCSNKLHCFPFICVCLIRLFSQWIPQTRLLIFVSMFYSIPDSSLL